MLTINMVLHNMSEFVEQLAEVAFRVATPLDVTVDIGILDSEELTFNIIVKDPNLAHFEGRPLVKAVIGHISSEMSQEALYDNYRVLLREMITRISKTLQERGTNGMSIQCKVLRHVFS